MNCLKCPYVKRHDTKIYCPFFSLEDCPLMGEHYIPGAAPKANPKPLVPAKPVLPKKEKVDAQPTYIPIYKAMHKSGRDAKIPWESHHAYIFQAIHDGKGTKEISRIIGVTHSTLKSYLRRYAEEKEK